MENKKVELAVTEVEVKDDGKTKFEVGVVYFGNNIYVDDTHFFKCIKRTAKTVTLQPMYYCATPYGVSDLNDFNSYKGEKFFSTADQKAFTKKIKNDSWLAENIWTNDGTELLANRFQHGEFGCNEKNAEIENAENAAQNSISSVVIEDVEINDDVEEDFLATLDTAIEEIEDTEFVAGCEYKNQGTLGGVFHVTKRTKCYVEGYLVIGSDVIKQKHRIGHTRKGEMTKNVADWMDDYKEKLWVSAVDKINTSARKAS